MIDDLIAYVQTHSEDTVDDIADFILNTDDDPIGGEIISFIRARYGADVRLPICKLVLLIRQGIAAIEDHLNNVDEATETIAPLNGAVNGVDTSDGKEDVKFKGAVYAAENEDTTEWTPADWGQKKLVTNELLGGYVGAEFASKLNPVKNDLRELKDLIESFFGGENVIWKFCEKNDAVNHGLTFSWNENSRLHIDGDHDVPSGLHGTYLTLYDGPIPEWMTPGMKMTGTTIFDVGDHTGVSWYVQFSAGSTVDERIYIDANTEFTVPSDRDNVAINVFVSDTTDGSHIHCGLRFGLFPEANFHGDVYAGGERLAKANELEELTAETRQRLKTATIETQKAMAEAAGFYPLVFRPGYYDTRDAGGRDFDNPGSSVNFVCAYAPVNPGDTVYLQVRGYTGAQCGWAILDDELSVLSRSDANIPATKYIAVVIPTGAAYIIVNNYVTQFAGYWAYVSHVDQTKERTKLSSLASVSGYEVLGFRPGYHYLYAPDYATIQPIDPTFPRESNPRSDVSYECAYSECVPGDQFAVRVATNAPAAHNTESVYAFLDSDGYCIERNAARVYDGIATAPDGAAFFVVNNSTTTTNRYAAKITGDIDAKKSYVNESIDAAIGEYAGYTEGESVAVVPQDNYYWNSQGDQAVLTALSSWGASEPIPVTAGDYYRVQIYCGNTTKAHPVLVVASDNTILAKYKQTTDTVNVIDFKVPEGAAYILLTSLRNSLRNATVNKLKLNSPKGDILSGMTVAVLGDSISTNGAEGANHNVPEIEIVETDVGQPLSAYLTYWDVAADVETRITGIDYSESNIGTEVPFTPQSEDVGKVIGRPDNYNNNSVRTWWEVMADALGCSVIPASWSGASITSHEKDYLDANDNPIYKCSWAWHPSQIRKCGIRIPGSIDRTAPDAIIIYRGTNDFSHQKYTRLTDGYFDAADWDYPADDVLETVAPETPGDPNQYICGYKEGLCLTIKKLRETYPQAKIFVCTLNVFKRINYSHFPTNNGINTLPQYNNAIREVANYMGCGLIEFDKCGVTFENMESGGFITESGKTHPNDKGHAAMGRKAIADIRAQWSKM